MTDPKPNPNAGPVMVSMESVKDHTYDGINRPVGEKYDVEEQYVDTVVGLGYAVRADRVEQAKKAREAQDAAKAAATKPRTGGARASQPETPPGTRRA